MCSGLKWFNPINLVTISFGSGPADLLSIVQTIIQQYFTKLTTLPIIFRHCEPTEHLLMISFGREPVMQISRFSKTAGIVIS